MLSQLLQILGENEGQIDLGVVSRQLGAEPSAVAGMLETLIAKGRIVEIGADCGVCSTCSLQNQCDLPVKRARRFRTVGRQPGSSAS